jgi:polar amino acid transport system permease protein
MSSEGSPQPSNGWGERFDRLSLASARVPFRLKVAVVWACIFAVIAVFFGLAQFNTDWMRDQFEFIAKGLPFTILIALAGIVLAVILALIGSLGRISQNPIAYGISGFYVSFFRGTPLIVQMFLIYFALPQVGTSLVDTFPGLGTNFSQSLVLEPFEAGIIALGLNYGAYMTEIFRAGIQAVPRGQREAALALGMPEQRVFRRIVLPQAFRIVTPAIGNDFIAMLKDSALISTISVHETLWISQRLGRSALEPMTALLIAALVYWVLTIIFSFFQERLERRMARSDR